MVLFLNSIVGTQPSSLLVAGTQEVTGHASRAHTGDKVRSSWPVH